MFPGGIFRDVPTGKRNHGQQYSRGDRRKLFLRTAVISGLWSVVVRYSTDPIRSPVPVETKKGDPGVTDHDRIRTDQSSGIYRICGAGLLGDRTCLCTYKKEKESVVSDGICGAFSHLCIGEPDFDL